MDHGVFIFLTDYGIDGPTLARATEERGFDGLYLTEHTHIPTSRESSWPGGSELPSRYSHAYDPFVALSAMAVVTERITLGTAVSLVLQHHPITLAKTVASLDRIAGGRFEFGVGPGWNREEMANHGVDPRTRTRRMLEHIAAMREIWTKEEAEFHGEFVDFDPIWSWPKPVRTPPVLIGGEGPTVLDRVLSHGDGWMPRGGQDDDVDVLAGRIAELRRRAVDAGRDGLTVTVFGAVRDRAAVESYAEAGVDRVLYGLPDAGEDEVLRTLDDLAGLSQPG
ncbi:LLM class F420-dependent oxidoreductase [Pseudonocardia sp. DSM 110487]|uniref:LLM class F420-dependent oxidoreductase n=1 Tax=Pseudonocardia sp. DSM 110487 TaxID=2865833 RepID=UPI001C69E449|nr:LLM class F420-dependent oxidoreductase [Pseudonocardia sp. DSM 110487]QYN35838.1 LLM class F420-dependent oxidoreductase [Pseudonocardia sp. DSM 110487]